MKKQWQTAPPNQRELMGAIVRKDIKAIGANIQVWLPMIILPLILGAAVPGLVIWLFASGKADIAGNQLDQLLTILDKVPEHMHRRLTGGYEQPLQQAAYFFLNYFTAPLFLLVPLMASSVISADSFAGEKERGTLEGLLFSPLSVTTLFVGKALAAFIPAMFLAFGTLALMAAVSNTFGWHLMGGFFFPNAVWLPLTLLVIPALSLAAILVNVYVSARVATFQAAYQVGGIVVLPVLALIFSQVTGVLFLSMPVVFAIGFGLMLLNVGLVLVLRRHLNRSQLFESQVQ